MTDDQINESMAKDPAAYEKRRENITENITTNGASMTESLGVEAILQEFADARNKGLNKYGGTIHDLNHTPYEWIAFAMRHLAKAIEQDQAEESMREELVKVGGLMLSATWCYDMTKERT